MSGQSSRLGSGGFAAAAGAVALVTLLSRVVGLVRVMVFSNAVGATCVGQVYATTNQLPNVLYEVAVGGALAAVVVPIVAKYLATGDDRSADAFSSAALTWAILLTLPLAIVLMIAAKPISAALMGPSAGCATAASDDAAALMLLLFAPQIVFYGIGMVLTGVLQAHRRFLAAATAPLLSSLVVIATYFVYAAITDGSTELVSPAAVAILAGGTTLGVVALSVPLFVPLKRTGAVLRPQLRFPGVSARTARALAAAGVIAVAAQQLTVLLTTLASNRVDAVGVVNVYTYTQTVYLLPYAVLVVPVATVAFPRLADPEVAADVLSRTAQVIVVTATAAALVLVAVRQNIGAFFLTIDAGSSGLGAAALQGMPTAVAWFAPGLVGFGLMALTSRALYVAGQAKRAALGQALAWVIAGLGPIAVWTFGQEWPAQVALLVFGLASTLGMTAGGVLLAFWARDAYPSAQLRPAARLIAALLVTVAVVLLAQWFWASAGPNWATATWWGSLAQAGAGAMAVLVVLAVVVRAVDAPTYSAVLGALTSRRGGRSQ